jgi:formimidoylglutamate deiminase
MPEEMRWLEYVQRLARERRGVCQDSDGEVGRELFRMATVAGARALGVPVGRIEVGYQADFLTLDLAAPALVGSDAETLLDAFVFGAPDGVIAEVAVGGKWL